MSINKWTAVLVQAENTSDMTYSFMFHNEWGKPCWAKRVRPLAGARHFLFGAGLKKNVDYDYTADIKTGEYCYKFKEPGSAMLFKLWFDKDSPIKMKTGRINHICPECGHDF